MLLLLAMSACAVVQTAGVLRRGPLAAGAALLQGDVHLANSHAHHHTPLDKQPRWGEHTRNSDSPEPPLNTVLNTHTALRQNRASACRACSTPHHT